MNITIYTSNHCITCQEVIHYFQEKKLSFRQLDVGYNKENFTEMLRLGGIATPFIIVGIHKFHSFDPNRIEEVLMKNHG